MANAEATKRWLRAARVVTALCGLTLWAMFFEVQRDGVTQLREVWVVTPYILMFTLLFVRPVARIVLGTILVLGPTALFLCCFLILFSLATGLGELSRGVLWLLLFATLSTASHVSLFAVAANAYRHESGPKAAWTLVLTGLVILGVLLGIAFWVKS